ncbi:MAG: stage II sporulation protein M [archaeon]
MKIKRKEGFFSHNYSECWKYFIKIRWYLIFTLSIFCLLFIIGFLFPVFFREEIFDFVKKLEEILGGKNTLELIGYIIYNNLKASFLAVLLGVCLGIIPLVILVVNGYLLGFVAREAVNANGILVLWRLVPHGIFEFPAILFSIGIGFKIGSIFFNGSVRKDLRRNLIEGFRFFIFVVIPLLIVAGIIEGILVGNGV